MVILPPQNVTSNHRQNRRRERPGSRTRRTISRKWDLQNDYTEGLLDARDNNVLLPSDKSRPSPLLRENFHQSWQRWQARQAEEKALAEIKSMETIQLELEQQRLFGGDVDDDELRRMGILYTEEDDDVARDGESNTVSFDVPVKQALPLFVLRHGRPRRSRRRRPTWQNLPLYLSLSNLRDDTDIARLLSHSNPHLSTIQHRNITSPLADIADIPQSLPTPSALESDSSSCGSISYSHLISRNTTPSAHSFDIGPGEWTFINSPLHTQPQFSPSSEPETWILLSDDS